MGTGNGNVAVRQAQYRAAFDEPSSLAFARDLVAAKVRNSRTMLRRNWRVNGDAEAKNEALVRLKRIVQRVPRARGDRQLLGIEGEAAAIYFACFENMLAAGAKEDMAAFSFSKRNRRPPIVADSCVIQAINNGEVKPGDFVFNGPACSLKPGGRKAFIAAFERRMDQETTHPLFGYRVSMRRLIEVQVRLLARHLQGEIVTYPHYLPR